MKGGRFALVQVLLAILIGSLWFGFCEAEEKAKAVDEKVKDSYSLGYEFGGHIKSQLVEFDLESVIAGIRDAYTGSPPKLTSEEMKDTLVNLKKRAWTAKQIKYQEQAALNLKAGKQFLIENAKKEGVVTLPSGLQYKILKGGEGVSPKVTDWVTVHYRGTLVDGTEFDSSYARGKPSNIQVSGVIKGWTEALQLMKEGGRWQVFVPAALAYDKRQVGRIPPNSTLIFEIELLSIESGPPAMTTSATQAILSADGEGHHNSTSTTHDEHSKALENSPE